MRYYPDVYPTADQLWRERDREAREDAAVMRMRPVVKIMEEISALKERMAAICNLNQTDARTVEAFFQWGCEWQHEQRRATE
jgi:hypothetical protein